MSAQLLAVIGSVLSIVIGLWKYFAGKERIRQQKKEEAHSELKKGLENKDAGRITSAFDRLNRMR